LESRFKDSLFRLLDAKERSMKIFVTGASGYIGKVVVEHAVRAGHVVEGLTRGYALARPAFGN
jgi:NAD(P)-dependent dehydrogenase (short-subunit alcohol dehydrogenase family)